MKSDDVYLNVYLLALDLDTRSVNILPKGKNIFRRNMFIVCSFYVSNLARSNLGTQAFEQTLFQMLQLRYF